MSEEQVKESAAVEPGQIVMPFYLVCDVSASMTSTCRRLTTESSG